MEEFKEATISDPKFLERNNIEVYKSAPYGQVEKAMSRGKLNPILIRPILKKLRFVTPRMFETLLADTIPLIPSYFAQYLYEEGIERFVLSDDNPSEDILRILRDYENNRKIVKKIRENLKQKHSYESRLKQLLQFV